NNMRFSGPPPRAADGSFKPPEFPDSSAIVRVDLTTRQMDTLAFLKVMKIKMNMVPRENGGFTMTNEVNPLPQVDEWAVLSDGTLAIVRGRDYHVDFISADGKLTSAPKVPFEWQRLSDEDKVALIDSVKAQRERMLASMPAPVAGAGGANQQVVGGG